MSKIPSHIQNYIDTAVGRQRALFANDLKSFEQRIVDEFRHYTGAILNEFDSHLKTVGEYIDTKTSKEDVRRIIRKEIK